MSIYDLWVHKTISVAIVGGLNFISRLSLCRVFPILRNKIPKHLDFRFVVKCRLVELFSIEEAEGMRIAEEILTNMHNTQTWMSGSFVLKCLTGINFEVGDIDFFTNNYITKFQRTYNKRHDVDYNFISYFSYKLYKKNIFDKKLFEYKKNSINRVVHSNVKHLVKEEEPAKAILSIREFYINKKCLQDIVIDESYPIDEYIREIFDMSFLKNMYDGRKLRIFDPEAVLKQKTIVNMFQAYYKSFRHAFWYERPQSDAQNRFMERQYKRITKYRKRGFVVDLDFTKDIESLERLCQRWEQSEYKMTEEDLSKWDNIANKDTMLEFEDKLIPEEEELIPEYEDLSDEN